MDIQKLHEMAFEVTPEILTPGSGYEHLGEFWKTILGGFVLPRMAELDPSSVAGNTVFKDLVEQYTKEKVEAMFSPRTIEIEKIVEVEVIKEVEVRTYIDKPVLLNPGENVVHRRLKDHIQKLRRKKRELTCSERDIVIKVFNDTQDMIPSTSEVFKNIVDEINAKCSPEDHVSAPQMAGYWSSLCRWADSTRVSREEWIERSLKRGVYSISPLYTDEFIAKIKENYAAKREEEIQRKKDHSHIKRTGDRKSTVLPTPQPKPEEEIDFSDIC